MRRASRRAAAGAELQHRRSRVLLKEPQPETALGIRNILNRTDEDEVRGRKQ
jgi:hypothetical protein